MPESRCGLNCTGCPWKKSHGCGGCIETMGHPFHGECPVALCCQSKGLVHCGECDLIPCEKLYAYSYLDPEHGDKPQGARVINCRRWAAESGKQAWENVLLTSAGWWRTFEGGEKENIKNRFLQMLGKPVKDAKVLFIPTAAIDEEAKKAAGKCREELLSAGIREGNIRIYDVGESLSIDEALRFDALYVTGGSTFHLNNKIKETGFDKIVKKMVYANKVYVGASAGSLVATPNIGDPFDDKTSGLCLVNAYLSVHCPPGEKPRKDTPLPHIPLTDDQALEVRWDGYRIIEN